MGSHLGDQARGVPSWRCGSDLWALASLWGSSWSFVAPHWLFVLGPWGQSDNLVGGMKSPFCFSGDWVRLRGLGKYKGEVTDSVHMSEAKAIVVSCLSTSSGDSSVAVGWHWPQVLWILCLYQPHLPSSAMFCFNWACSSSVTIYRQMYLSRSLKSIYIAWSSHAALHIPTLYMYATLVPRMDILMLVLHNSNYIVGVQCTGLCALESSS